MKKKILSILLMGILVIVLTGCDGNKATVINNKNEKEELSAKDIYNISEGNEEKFKKYYVGAKISFDGTVESVETSDFNCYNDTDFERRESGVGATLTSSSDTRRCATINFAEGYKLMIPSKLIDISDISKGDKFHVDSNIGAMWNEQVECFGVKEGNIADFDLTKIVKK